ncbi:MAG: PLP-dependent transferase [Opitutaceae bacterium]
MAAFAHQKLGQRIPGGAHSVSCSLPTMRDVRGYEEKDPETMRALSSGYPRFVVHPFARRLTEHLLASDPGLRGRDLWLVPSEGASKRLTAHLGPGSDARPFSRDGLHGVSHPVSPELSARAKTYMQNTGGFLSSREAEDRLVRLGLLPAVQTEVLFAGAPAAHVHAHLRDALPGATEADVFLAPSGMNAVWAAFRAAAALQSARGRTVWLQLGWLYLDTIAILQRFTGAPGNHIHVRDPLDLRGIEKVLGTLGARVAGVIAEVPTNPLIQTPDLPALGELCRRHGALLIVDPSIASIHNVNVLPHADLVVASLTKYAASDGDLTAGLVAVNPAGRDAAALRAALPAEIEPVYPRDLSRLAAQIGHTREVLARIHTNTARVAAFLASHPAVGEVRWALQADCAANFRRIARTPGATGGVITFTLRRKGALEPFYDHLRLPKGPSFGMKTTLICPFMYLAHYDLVTTPAGLAELAASGVNPDLLRLCCGTEPAEEIIGALSEAFDAAR